MFVKNIANSVIVTFLNSTSPATNVMSVWIRVVEMHSS